MCGPARLNQLNFKLDGLRVGLRLTRTYQVTQLDQLNSRVPSSMATLHLSCARLSLYIYQWTEFTPYSSKCLNPLNQNCLTCLTYRDYQILSLVCHVFWLQVLPKITQSFSSCYFCPFAVRRSFQLN